MLYTLDDHLTVLDLSKSKLLIKMETFHSSLNITLIWHSCWSTVLNQVPPSLGGGGGRGNSFPYWEFEVQYPVTVRCCTFNIQNNRATI